MSVMYPHDPRVIGVQMYRGRVIAMSFPIDGNKHNEQWEGQELTALINGKPTSITIQRYADGSLISIEVGLPMETTDLRTACE